MFGGRGLKADWDNESDDSLGSDDDGYAHPGPSTKTVNETAGRQEAGGAKGDGGEEEYYDEGDYDEGDEYYGDEGDWEEEEPQFVTCEVENCRRRQFKNNWCATHYAEQKGFMEKQGAGGSGAPPQPGQGPEDRWWDKKEEHSVWQQCKSKDGLDYYYNTVTHQTTWDKPEELMTPDELANAGDWRWVPDEEECFLAGKVLESAGDSTTVEMEDGSERVVPLNCAKMEPLSRVSLQRIVSDLVLLDRMSAPLILHCLRKRFEDNKIYTNVGTILISINPYQRLPMYGPDMIERFKAKKVGQDMQPHVFGIAHDSYYGITQFKKNQSIIISGESGAGKTEATKQCLKFLAAMAGSVGGVEKKVLQANPILEAFGNAKTIRNDNSSRFGKYMEISFNSDGAICGSATKNYLLEKIRVCQQGENERNFHIFYQLTKAAGPELQARLDLEPPNMYEYTQTCVNVDTIDDEKDFAEVTQAWEDLGFADDDVEAIYSVVVGVLTLGNANFRPSGRMVTPVDNRPLNTSARLFQVDPSALTRAVTVRELRIPGQKTTEVFLNKKQAKDTTGAMAKFVYAKLFDWLVITVNKLMGKVPRGEITKIGILDIFGFEIFEHNSFEQLCINFTNEMLQQHFNQHTFKLEEELYRREKIKFKHVAFIDNQPMIELITKKPTGILPLLDEELVVPRGNDRTFLQKLAKHQSENKIFRKVMKRPTNFGVRHYAGKVEYDSRGFLEKNRDTLTQDVMEMLSSSDLFLMQELFPKSTVLSSQEAKSSLSRQFQGQLTDLMNTLNKTEPHYIRCVKPNETKSPMSFMPKNCLEQLTYSGVFEAVSIRKQGFPFRLRHREFAERYMCILGKIELGEKEPVLDVCAQIIDDLQLDRSNVQIGTRHALYRAEEHKSLELQRSIKVRVIEVHQALRRLLSEDPYQLSDEDKELYFKQLNDALTGADQFRIESEDAIKARKMLEQYVEERMDPQTRKLLEAAYRTTSHDKLREALAICDEKGYRTKLTLACKHKLEEIEDADVAVQVALEEMEEDLLEAALLMCEEFAYEPPSVHKARSFLRQVTRANTMIKLSMQAKDHVKLQKTIMYCKSFGYVSSELDKVRKLLKRILYARELLLRAKDKGNQAELETALALCDHLNYHCALVDDARALAVRISRVLKEAKRANRTLDERHMRACLQAAAEVKLKHKGLSQFKSLLAGPVRPLLNAQYKLAAKNGDMERAIRISMKKKDELIKETGSQYELSNFPGLKEPLAWAKEKWSIWGGYEEKARTMLKWQELPIHSPVTHLARDTVSVQRHQALTQVIVRSFETIQMWMGQRDGRRLMDRVNEMLEYAVKTPDIRDELYTLMIKQMTNNPHYAAVTRGWDLVAMCLTLFPPSQLFEDYLEYFLRSDTEHGKKLQVTYLMRKRVHEGVDKAMAPCLTLSTYEQFIRSYIVDEQEPEDTSYCDLLDSFYPGGYKASAQKAGRVGNVSTAMVLVQTDKDFGAKGEWRRQRANKKGGDDDDDDGVLGSDTDPDSGSDDDSDMERDLAAPGYAQEQAKAVRAARQDIGQDNYVMVGDGRRVRAARDIGRQRMEGAEVVAAGKSSRAKKKKKKKQKKGEGASSSSSSSSRADGKKKKKKRKKKAP